MKIITISGASGSGKSTVAEYIKKSKPNSLLLSLDRYYLSKNQQIEKNGFCNFDNPAALDIDLLLAHLITLKQEGRVHVPIYDFTISERSGYEQVTATDLIIIDGLFSGAVLTDISDLNIFVDVDLDLALLRRIDRDMAQRGRSLESVIEQYKNYVRPAYFEYIECIKSDAHIILTNNHTTDQLIEESRKIMDLIGT